MRLVHRTQHGGGERRGDAAHPQGEEQYGRQDLGPIAAACVDPQRKQESRPDDQGPEGERRARSDVGGEASGPARGEGDHQGKRQQGCASGRPRIACDLDQQVGQEHEQRSQRPIEQQSQHGQADERARCEQAQRHHGLVSTPAFSQDEGREQERARDDGRRRAGGPSGPS